MPASLERARKAGTVSPVLKVVVTVISGSWADSRRASSASSSARGSRPPDTGLHVGRTQKSERRAPD